MRLIKSLCIIAFAQLWVQSSGFAQSCLETLNLAREEFEAGHLYGVPALLKPCLDRGFNKDQKIQAYWLLTRTYLFIDDPISAEDSYLKLLKLDPEYRIDPDHDPVDMVYLSRKFRTTPIFVLYARAGSNLTHITPINNYGVDDILNSKESYKNKVGFHIGGGGEVNLTNDLSFGIDANFYNKKYAYSNTLFGQDQQTLAENQFGIYFPAYIKYRWDFNKIRPFIYAGYGADILLSASASARLIDRSGQEGQSEFPVTGPEINIKDLRQTLNTFIHGGVGVNYRIGYNYITLDLRYMAGLNNIVDPTGQYKNTELLYKYGYIDDDKRLNNVSISIGYVKPLYKPRRIEKTSIPGLWNKIFGKK